MPELDVHSAIGQKSERLLHRVMDNAELAQSIMGIVSLICLTANERGKDLRGIRLGSVEMTGNRMIAKVSFASITVRRAAPEIPSVNSFMHFLKQEAEGLYLAIAHNPDWLIWMRQTIEKMEAYAEHKGIEFGDLTFGKTKNPGDGAAVFLDKEDNIVMELD